MLASALAVPEAARVLDRRQGGGPVLIVGAEGRAHDAARARLEERGAEVGVAPASGRWVSLPHALAMLHARGIRRLLVEGGARVLTSFVQERLADRAEIEIAPRIFGDEAVPAFGALAGEPPLGAVSLRDPAVGRLGGNVLVRGELEYST